MAAKALIELAGAARSGSRLRVAGAQLAALVPLARPGCAACGISLAGEAGSQQCTAVTMDQATSLRPGASAAMPGAPERLLRALAGAGAPGTGPRRGRVLRRTVRALQCERVSVGISDEDAPSLAGSSHPAELLPGQPATTAVLDAMHEALDQQQPVAWPPASDTDLITLAQRHLAGTGPPAACSWWTARSSARSPWSGCWFTQAELLLLEDASRLAGPVLALKRQAALPWRRRLVDSARERLAELHGAAPPSLPRRWRCWCCWRCRCPGA